MAHLYGDSSSVLKHAPKEEKVLAARPYTPEELAGLPAVLKQTIEKYLSKIRGDNSVADLAAELTTIQDEVTKPEPNVVFLQFSPGTIKIKAEAHRTKLHALNISVTALNRDVEGVVRNIGLLSSLVANKENISPASSPSASPTAAKPSQPH